MFHKIILLILLTIIAGCGGGGGGGGGASAPVITNSWQSFNSGSTSDVTAANNYRTSEYYNIGFTIGGVYGSGWGLEAMKVAQAYATLDKNGKVNHGKNVIVGLADSGVNTSSIEVSGNLYSAASYDYANGDSNVNASALDADGMRVDLHGTLMASIIAGVKNNSTGYGIAYESKIAVAKVACDVSSGANCAGQANGYSDTGILASAINGLVVSKNNGAAIEVINVSQGSLGNDPDLLAAIVNAQSSDVLIVAATGNDNSLASPVLNPRYPAAYAGSNSLTNEISVGAIESSNNDGTSANPSSPTGFSIAAYSNDCGTTAAYCLVAPGSKVNAAGYIGNGTSNATAYVSGAAAVIRGAWPHLTAAQTVQILLTTTTDLGAIGVDSVYGHGLLNLYEAVQAQGQNLLSYGATVGSIGYDVRASSFVSDPIFGDAFVQNIAPQLSSAVFFDDYGRDYKANLGSKISSKGVVNFSAQSMSNYNTHSIPLSFNFSKNSHLISEINVQYKSYKNAHLASLMNVDKSQEDKLIAQSAGFSFAQNFSKDFKAGFAFNNNQIANLSNDNFGFMSVSSISANPFQSFITNQTSSINGQQNQKSFNQVFLSKSFFDKKFVLNFSHQTSYQNNSLINKASARDNEISDFTFAFLPQQKSNFSVSFGNLNEFNNNFLNSQALGAFGSTGNVKTSYFKISATKKLFEGLSLISTFSQGTTQANGNDAGIFRKFQNINSRSSAIGLVSDKFFGGNIGAIYSQPMRVYSGSALIDVPTGLDANGNVIRYTANVSLKPRGKEQDFEIFFAKNLDANSSFKLNFIAQTQPGNIKDANTAYFWMGSYSKKF